MQNKTCRKFLVKVFDDSLHDYSEGCWADMSEELQASYTQHDIEGVLRIFTAFQRRFSIGALKTEITKKSQNERVHRLMGRKRSAEALIEDLYRVGMVGNAIVKDKHGNVVRGERWGFRGYDLPNFNVHFEVHPALWAKLELISYGESLPDPVG